MKTILLSGPTGFLGANLLNSLLEYGFNVIILIRNRSKLKKLKSIKKNYKLYNIDVDSIDSIFSKEKIDLVIHAATNYGRSSENFNDIIESNITFPTKILESSIKNKVNTFINIDTSLNKNINYYSLSKHHFKEILQHKMKLIKIKNIRIEHMYGPNDDENKLLNWLLLNFERRKKTIRLTAGTQFRDFIHVDDVCSAIICIIKNKITISKMVNYDVCSGKLITVKEFINLVKKIYEEVNGKIVTKLEFGAIPFRKNEVLKPQINNSVLLNLGWRPKIDIEDGIKSIIKGLG